MNRSESIPVGARVYVAAVSILGLAVVARSVFLIVRSELPVQWVLFAILTIASGMLTVKVPSLEARVSVSEAFAFASVLLFGPDVGVVTLALEGVRISFRWKMNRQQTVFNFANLGLSMWAAAGLFFYFSRITPLYLGPAPSWNIVLYLALMTGAYFAVNSGLTAVVVGLATRRPLRKVWLQHYWPLIPSYVAGASVSLLLVVAFREVGLLAVALILPLLLICYLTVRSSYGRVEDATVHVAELNRLLLSTVETLATAIDAKDEVTHDHVRRVQQGTLGLARELGVTDPDTLKGLEAAALLHDTGKIAVPEHILNKPGKLTATEFEKMKRHAPIGADILSSIDFPYPVVPIVRHHHENWDGTGYPDGLTGAAIPLGARILSVVDCFDALTSDRPYRRRMTEQDALKIIVDRRGIMYDPVVVDAFLGSYTRIMPSTDSTRHPVAQAIGDALSMDREEQRLQAAAPLTDAGVSDGLLAVTSLSRAVSGGARVADVGALMWMVIRQVLPCDTMAVFLPDERKDHVTVRYVSGAHAPALRAVSRATGTGVAGWVAVNRTPALNADPSLDLGAGSLDLLPGLRSCLAIPLVEGNTLVAVLALYRERVGAFSEDDVRLVELLAPRLASSLAEAVTFEESSSQPASATAPLKLVRRATSA
ncbi:MAG TPA: HD domain-containing phosphohydrolase [Vicinamibacterales bacterium]